MLPYNYQLQSHLYQWTTEWSIHLAESCFNLGQRSFRSPVVYLYITWPWHQQETFLPGFIGSITWPGHLPCTPPGVNGACPLSVKSANIVRDLYLKVILTCLLRLNNPQLFLVKNNKEWFESENKETRVMKRQETRPMIYSVSFKKVHLWHCTFAHPVGFKHKYELSVILK